jgi:protoporphyrinogen oxidase
MGIKPVVLERDATVGGIARTETYKGFHFDMGGHRFFTKSEQVRTAWHEILGADFLRRPRLSRIYYRRRFFYYPLKPFDTLRNVGLIESVLMVLSYLRWQIAPHRVEDTFEQWVTNRFGKRLFDAFFKTYTEKVWGIPCSELKAEWAAQRIKNLSLKAVLRSFLLPSRESITTLVEEFHYPRLGPGMMWSAVRKRVEEGGGTVRLGSSVSRIHWEPGRIESVVVGHDGRQESVDGTDFITSMPVTEFVKRLDPPAPTAVLEAARSLRYRDLLTVCLIVDGADLFPDNWIYVHDPSVKVARIQNFKNWSPEMVPDPGKTGLGLEYFCNEGDALWSMADADLVELGKRELAEIGLARGKRVEDGCVFRVPNSYPVYDSAYRASLDVIREFMDSFRNCRTIGRNGLHRYNNQDHSMLTGIYAVRDLALGEVHDVWSVNADDEYHEEIRETRPADALLDRAAVQLLEKIDPVALGVAGGVVCGVLLLLATLVLVVKGGPVVGPNLALLGQYLPGYSVTPRASLLGLAYGGSAGFLAGWGFAYVRNVTTYLSVALIRRRLSFGLLRRLLEEI